MAKFRKYVIVENNDFTYDIRFGYVEFHRHLENASDRRNGIRIVGGGIWTEDMEEKKIYLSGSSSDYGKATPEQINKAIKRFDDWFHLSWTIKMINRLTSHPELDDFMIVNKIY